MVGLRQLMAQQMHVPKAYAALKQLLFSSCFERGLARVYQAQEHNRSKVSKGLHLRYATR